MSDRKSAPKKKRRPARATQGAAEATRPAGARVRVSDIAVSESKTAGSTSPPWTTGKFVMVLAAGFAIGGAGGYLLRSTGSASKVGTGDASSAQPANQQQGAADQQQSGDVKALAPKPMTGPSSPIALAAWTPREGPEHAKVTIVEFSDFQ